MVAHGTPALIAPFLALALACSGETPEAAPSPGESVGDAGPPAPLADAATPAPSFEIETIEIPVGEYVFDARAAGPVEGELVLLLHGFPQTSYEWMAQIPVLAAAGYRVVAPDQRGYSPRARPTEVESYSVVALVGDVLGMADTLGHERFHLVGHDWGGGVAWGVAGVVPERVRSLTALSTPSPGALSRALADTESCQYEASAYFEVLSQPEVTLEDLASIGVGFDGVPEDAVAVYMDEVLLKPETPSS
jgi:pimeloyl-ACP methyl ester carboxylesterase